MSEKSLKDWSTAGLNQERRYQQAAGCLSLCDYCKKRSSHSDGPCVECINDELKRRGLSDDNEPTMKPLYRRLSL